MLHDPSYIILICFMIIKKKVSHLKGTALFWKRAGAAAHLHLKRHARKQCISACTQNRHFSNDNEIDL